MIKFFKRKSVRWALVFLCAMGIISMSYMNNVVSWYLTGQLLTVIETGSIDRETSYEEQMQSFNKEETASKMVSLRKAAHIIEFFIFALLLYYAFRYDFSMKKSFILALAAGWAFGGLDEFHQTFVPGRDGNLFDVLLDGIGTTAGAIFAVGVDRIRQVISYGA